MAGALYLFGRTMAVIAVIFLVEAIGEPAFKGQLWWMCLASLAFAGVGVLLAKRFAPHYARDIVGRMNPPPEE